MTTDDHVDDGHALGRSDDGLVGTVVRLHAQVRDAVDLVHEDPVAAAAALRGLALASGAAIEALRTPERPQLLGADDATLATESLDALRASAGSIRFAVHGPEGRLPPRHRTVLGSLMREVLTSTEGAGSLSVSFTWSPDHLDVLVVFGPSPAPPRSGPGLAGPDDLPCSRALVLAAGGVLRVQTPRAGGVVVAATLPLPSSTEAGAAP